jgi:hypothetical protein
VRRRRSRTGGETGKLYSGRDLRRRGLSGAGGEDPANDGLARCAPAPVTLALGHPTPMPTPRNWRWGTSRQPRVPRCEPLGKITRIRVGRGVPQHAPGEREVPSAHSGTRDRRPAGKSPHVTGSESWQALSPRPSRTRSPRGEASATPGRQFAPLAPITVQQHHRLVRGDLRTCDGEDHAPPRWARGAPARMARARGAPARAGGIRVPQRSHGIGAGAPARPGTAREAVRRSRDPVRCGQRIPKGATSLAP